jgi:hypothetical protein
MDLFKKVSIHADFLHMIWQAGNRLRPNKLAQIQIMHAMMQGARRISSVDFCGVTSFQQIISKKWKHQ